MRVCPLARACRAHPHNHTHKHKTRKYTLSHAPRRRLPQFADDIAKSADVVSRVRGFSGATQLPWSSSGPALPPMLARGASADDMDEALEVEGRGAGATPSPPPSVPAGWRGGGGGVGAAVPGSPPWSGGGGGGGEGGGAGGALQRYDTYNVYGRIAREARERPESSYYVYSVGERARGRDRAEAALHVQAVGARERGRERAESAYHAPECGPGARREGGDSDSAGPEDGERPRSGLEGPGGSPRI